MQVNEDNVAALMSDLNTASAGTLSAPDISNAMHAFASIVAFDRGA